MENKRVAVILSGCGYLDGAEVRESVLSLLSLDQLKAKATIFAPDINQMHVVNHQTGEPMEGERRNVLIESARISRGNVHQLSSLDPDNFDALILPGGFGVAKNLSDLATSGNNVTVLETLQSILCGFYQQSKPIGAICIAPAIIVATIREVADQPIQATIGKDDDNLIESLGGNHKAGNARFVCVDVPNKIVTTPAYMLENEPLSSIACGIDELVKKVLTMA